MLGFSGEDGVAGADGGSSQGSGSQGVSLTYKGVTYPGGQPVPYFDPGHGWLPASAGGGSGAAVGTPGAQGTNYYVYDDMVVTAADGVTPSINGEDATYLGSGGSGGHGGSGGGGPRLSNDLGYYVRDASVGGSGSKGGNGSNGFGIMYHA